MIIGLHNSDIMEDLKRDEHILFSLPFEGGKVALDRDTDEGGYGFLHYLADEHSVPIADIPEKGVAPENFGEMWSWHDEDSRVTYWGVYNHIMQIGWHPIWYTVGADKLTAWWESIEADVPGGRGVRSLVLGHGRNLRRIAAETGGLNWNVIEGLGVLANTEAELRLYHQG